MVFYLDRVGVSRFGGRQSVSVSFDDWTMCTCVPFCDGFDVNNWVA